MPNYITSKSIPKIGEAWLLHADNRVTRRKIFAVVFDPQGERRFQSRLIGECIAYLDAEEVEEYYLYSPDAPNLLSLCKVSYQKEKE